MKHIKLYEEFVNEDILNAPNQKLWSTKFSINYDDLPSNLNLTTAYLDKLLKGIPYQHYAFPEVSDDGALLFKTSQDLIKAQQRLNTVKESFHNIVESTIEDFIKDIKNHDDILSSGAYEKDGKIVVYLDGSDPDAEEKAINKWVRTKYKDKLKKVNDGSEDTITFKVLKESYQPSLVESKIGDIYIMAGEAPNFPTFMKEFVKEYGEVKGSKEEKDLNTWLKSVWDERPTNESTKEDKKALNESTDITQHYKGYNKEVKNAANALKQIISGYDMRTSYDTELYDAIIELVDAVKADRANESVNESTDITQYYKGYNQEVKNAAKAVKDIVSGYHMRTSYDTELYDAIIELVNAVKADRDNKE
jgi:hypothetical protein